MAYLLKYKGPHRDSSIKVIRAKQGVDEATAAKAADDTDGLTIETKAEGEAIIAQYGASDSGDDDANLWSLIRIKGGKPK